MYTAVAVTLDIFCIRPFALHRQQPEKDNQNVDFAPPGKISADAHGHQQTEGYSFRLKAQLNFRWRVNKKI